MYKDYCVIASSLASFVNNRSLKGLVVVIVASNAHNTGPTQAHIKTYSVVRFSCLLVLGIFVAQCQDTVSRSVCRIMKYLGTLFSQCTEADAFNYC